MHSSQAVNRHDAMHQEPLNLPTSGFTPHRFLQFPSWFPIGALIAGLTCTLAYHLSYNVVDPDLWHEMALAREIIGLGHVPMLDRFAYTPTVSPSVHHEWGAGLIAFAIAQTIGAGGILFAKFAIAFGLAALCWRGSRFNGAGIGILAFCMPLALLLMGQGFSALRAQMYSYAFVALLLTFLDKDHMGREGWWKVWLPLYVLWLNVHGGFVMGLILLGIYWVERFVVGSKHRHILLCSAVMGALVVLNPYGPAYYGYLWPALTMPRPYVREWGPLFSVGETWRIVAFLASFSLVAIAITIHPRWPPPRGSLLVIGTALGALLHMRMVFFYAIVWVWYVPGHLQGTGLGAAVERFWRGWPRFQSVFWSALAVIMVSKAIPMSPWELRVPGFPPESRSEEPVYPVGAVRYLESIQFHGNVMVHFNSGSFLLWKLFPAIRVSIDGRYEVAYPPWLAEENQQLYEARNGWQAVLEAYPTDLVLVATRFPLARALASLRGWTEVYADNCFLIYAREPSALPRVRSSEPINGKFP